MSCCCIYLGTQRSKIRKNKRFNISSDVKKNTYEDILPELLKSLNPGLL